MVSSTAYNIMTREYGTLCILKVHTRRTKTVSHMERYMTDHAGPRRYECNPVFKIVTREICNLVLKFHNPMKICGTR